MTPLGRLRLAIAPAAPALLAVGLGAGCGSSPEVDSAFGSVKVDASTFIATDSASDARLFSGDGSGGSVNVDAAQTFDVEPSAAQTIAVTAGHTTPALVYKATLDGAPISAAWTVDRGDLATIGAGPSAQASLQPTGTTGGLVNVIAGLNGHTVRRQVFIELMAQQNGANINAPGESQQVATSVAQLGAGGGIGGVGGEGLGGPVTDAATLAALASPAGNGQAQALQFLYPYDQTVFPRGLLAPLLQWTSSFGNADAISIQLRTTSGSFSWTGTFSAPTILAQTGGSFIRSPIPQDVWTMATNTAGGTTPSNTPDQLEVSVVLASGGVGYGPIRETWNIAPARLEGTVYYNSYGTQLVKNSLDVDFNGQQYGAAVLGITEGATGPSVVAGNESPLPTGTGCRVCHVVSSDGSTLITQHGDDYALTSAYGLTNGNAEDVLTNYDDIFGWAGLTRDGSLALTNAADLAAEPADVATATSALYAFPPASTGAVPLAAIGLPPDLQAGTPAFSPDGTHVAFGFLGGTIGTATGNGTQLVALDFDSSQLSFSNLRPLATMTGGMRAGFPSFFPTNDAVAFHYQIVNSNHEYNTWHGAEAQIWWSDLPTGTATSLDALNGLTAGGAASYLPVGPENHANDTVLNYEPTVNPIASGGYIWVIFTSRRLYGNVATTDPWQSDPRDYDATQVANTTCKKLWVAAIDLNAKAGTDPSHPAFYLPAQELLAGNARGFWVLDPCKPDGQSCQSGDECCNGYCEPGSADGGLTCTSTPPNTSCSQSQEKCESTSNCCDTSNVCVNGFCTVSSAQ